MGDNAAIPPVALPSEDQDACQLGADCTAGPPGIRKLARLRHWPGGRRADGLYRRTLPLSPPVGPRRNPLAPLLRHACCRAPARTGPGPRWPAPHLSRLPANHLLLHLWQSLLCPSLLCRSWSPWLLPARRGLEPARSLLLGSVARVGRLRDHRRILPGESDRAGAHPGTSA